MKNLIIIGAGRSGKTTLSNVLCKKFGYSILSLDALAHAFGSAFPHLGIHYNSLNNSSLISDFVKIYTHAHTYIYPKIPIIIEGAHLDLVTIAKDFDREKFDIIVLGFPNISPQDKYGELRKHDGKNDWTSKLSDRSLMDVIVRDIQFSKYLKNECEKHNNITFLDTSLNRKKVLNQFINDLEIGLS